jgi:hypothetical protein
MSAHRRFVAGMAGLCLGNALLAGGYLLDRSLLGPVTLFALVGSALAAVGAGVVLYVAVSDPEQFSFEESSAAHRAPLVALAGGAGAVLAGLVNLAVAFGL